MNIKLILEKILKKLVLILFFGLFIVNVHSQDSRLIGKWFFNDFWGSQSVLLEFSQNEITMNFLENGYRPPHAYQTDGKELTLIRLYSEIDEDFFTLRYEIQNDKINITNNEGDIFIGTKLVNIGITSLTGNFSKVWDSHFSIGNIEFLDNSNVLFYVHGYDGQIGSLYRGIYRINNYELIISDTIVENIFNDGSEVMVSERMMGMIFLEIITDTILYYDHDRNGGNFNSMFYMKR
jgi:hypothetical protein